MRSEKIRKADKAVFCRSASKRYRIIVHRGHRSGLGHGCTTGHQKSIPVLRKQTCCTSCQNSKRSASSYRPGTCQATVLTVNATKHTTGWVRKRPRYWSAVEAKTLLSAYCNADRGSPCSSGKIGAPSRRSGGTTIISSKC